MGMVYIRKKLLDRVIRITKTNKEVPKWINRAVEIELYHEAMVRAKINEAVKEKAINGSTTPSKKNWRR